MNNAYENVGFDSQYSVSGDSRNFQKSIVISQDPNKAGILSFLPNIEQTQINQSSQQSPLTLRPSSEGGA